jgi:hypothetical protein
MRTAPPAVPGIAHPNSIPESPHPVARLTIAASEAPPPHVTRSPSRSMRARSPASRMTTPS